MFEVSKLLTPTCRTRCFGYFSHTEVMFPTWLEVASASSMVVPYSSLGRCFMLRDVEDVEQFDGSFGINGREFFLAREKTKDSILSQRGNVLLQSRISMKDTFLTW